ncbi:MAG: sulfate ABC transporter permease [Candidatus Kerfeldbacteria bacterium RIFOXYA2_FULL_38_24]|uniref:Sulfate ABC transporter permease n=1 Tax=Candidatus Kerfeldbacteria bacterium RIFOXYB2_FULL_38_14 TaxID=1798547 RepID=A0A1G2BI02_9BACT|nr:MAG: sulfate ABC transporter permease [Candidatus Kerfeldbacteria bacterium RIFOXYA2_FULL_38_24]OGY88149.1 MAG: sulfate ABC transporter permease [Candidatus Kerfeldbacteria bacterium RIFOXYB2_FULL_38_14]OGY89610.1 MAG: sulfate ABC transporter permease [Candidatus Kerfeldbacteria bacterium RIFOXYC2_FULL_38_9]
MIFLLFLLLIWWLLYKIHFWPAWLFPSPRQVFKTLIKGFANHTFIWGILISMRRLFIGFGFALLVGSFVGFLLAKVKIINETVGFLVLGLQTLPSICWLPLALLWFGLNEKAIIFVVIMGSIMSMTIAMESAVKNIPPLFIRAGKMLGVQGWQLFCHVIFPAILPSFITGIKQGWSFAWRSLMSGEMLFITLGLGQLLMIGRQLNDMSQVMAVMLVIIMIGIIFDKLIFGVMENSVRRKWGLK